jgi:hypothetical protein
MRQTTVLLIAALASATSRADERSRADVKRLVEAVRASCLAVTRTPDDSARILAAIPKLTFATAHVREWVERGVSFELRRPLDVTLTQLGRFLGHWTVWVGEPGSEMEDTAPEMVDFDARLRGERNRECSLIARTVSPVAPNQPVLELELHVVTARHP